MEYRHYLVIILNMVFLLYCLLLREAPVPPASIISGDTPFRYLGTETALAPKVRCRSQRQRIIAGASALAHTLRGHVYTAQQGIAVATMALESTFSFSASTADWDTKSLNALLLAWARAHKAAGKLANNCAGCLLTWPASSGAAPFPPPHTILLRALMEEVSRLVTFDDHVRLLARRELHHLFTKAGTCDLGLVGRWIALEPQEGPVAALLGLASRLDIDIVLPAALTPGPERSAGSGDRSWLRVFFENVDRRCSVSCSYALFRPFFDQCVRSNLLPGHMTAQEITIRLGACLVNLNPDMAVPAVIVRDSTAAQGPIQRPITNYFQPEAGGGPRVVPPPTLMTVMDLLGALDCRRGSDRTKATKLNGQINYFPDAFIQDFEPRRRELFDIVQHQLPGIVTDIKGAEALQNRKCSEKEFIKACEAVVRSHNLRRMQRKYARTLEAFFKDAALPRPAATDGKLEFECTVVAVKLVKHNNKWRDEFLVTWDGWGDEGARWRAVKGLTSDPAMKAKYAHFILHRGLPPNPAQRPTATKESEWGWRGVSGEHSAQQNELGPLDPTLVTVATHPTTDVPTVIRPYTLNHCKGLTSVHLGRERVPKSRVVEGAQSATVPKPLLLINTGRLGWLLDLLGGASDPLDEVLQMAEARAQREQAFPVLSQQGQELLTRGTGIVRVKGTCPLTVWAGLDS